MRRLSLLFCALYASGCTGTISTYVGSDEIANSKGPSLPDRDGDGLPDVHEDKNGNGKLDPGETDPDLPDTDNDGLSDGLEWRIGSNPRTGDSDGDGYSDHQEWLFGSNPTDPTSTPQGNSCASEIISAEQRVRPVDIIVAVDGSSSMSNEIRGIEDFINADFASTLDAQGIDYQVILVAHYGNSADITSQTIYKVSGDREDFYGICIEAPLGANTCDVAPGNRDANGDNSVDLVQPAPLQAQRLTHIDQAVDSHDALSALMYTFDQDAYRFETGRVAGQGLAPNGWSTVLRPNSWKVFVVFSDDQSNVRPATFEAWLSGGDRASHFWNGNERNYEFHSVVGVKPNDLPGRMNEDPWLPSDPLVDSKCSTATAVGARFQSLSIDSGGLRFSVCNDGYDPTTGTGSDSYRQLFASLAADAIEGSQLPCSYVLPPPPPGKRYDFNGVILRYTPAGGTAVDFTVTDSEAACGSDLAYYVADQTINLCPAACTLARSGEGGTVQLDVSCAGYVIE